MPAKPPQEQSHFLTTLVAVAIALVISAFAQHLLGKVPSSPASDNNTSLSFVFSHEVEVALQQGRAVVALESTIITHGMPYPENLKTAQDVEKVIRERGAVPATIAIINGAVHIGLTNAELEWLAQYPHAVKCSRRDIAVIIAERQTGSTTVAATSFLARLAHISVFVTGGIGGVHRGGEVTLDVSADLTELGRTDITVVCAGAKSILDIGRTLEYMETQGVTVIGYGTNEFPAFFSPTSGFPAPLRLDTPEQVARVIAANSAIKLKSGILVGVPIPAHYATETKHIEAAIQQALKDADELRITGNEITPFLLQHIANLTKGDSLSANIALIKNNARVGADIAVALAQLVQPKTTSGAHSQIYAAPAEHTSEPAVVVLGGAVVDVIGHPSGKLIPHTSNPGSLKLSIGGVGRNIAEGLARLGTHTKLLSIVGKDSYGDLILSHTAAVGVDTSVVQRANHESGVYAATLDEKGGLTVAIAATSIFDLLTPEYVTTHYETQITSSKFVVIDANAPVPTISYICNKAYSRNIAIWFEPTSMAKVVKIVEADVLHLLTYISPNRGELIAISQALKGGSGDLVVPEEGGSVDEFKPLVALLLDKGVKGVIAKLGSDGVLVGESFPRSIVHYAAPPAHVVSVTGAGDSLAAGTIWALNNGAPLNAAVKYGLAAAHLTLESDQAISPLISATKLQQMVLENTER